MTDSLIKRLDALHAAGKMHGFSLWPSQGGYQASLAVTHNSFRIRVADTPGEAIAEVLDGRGPLEERSEPVRAARDVFEPEPPAEESIFG